MAKTNNTFEDITTIFEGTLMSAYKNKSEDNNGVVTVKNTMRVVPDDVKVFDEIVAYNESGNKFTPDWLKNREHIMLRSVYDVPFKTPQGEKLSFDEFCERGLIRNAKVKVKMIQKEGAVYPSAVVILADGEEYDPFSDM